MASLKTIRRTFSSQTSDATQMTVMSFPVPDGGVIYPRAVVLAYRTSNGDAAGWELSGIAKRASGGSGGLLGAILNPLLRADAGAATWAATMDVDSNLIRVRVTGQLLATIDWAVFFDAYSRVA